MSLPPKTKYGELSWAESFGFVTTVLTLPVALLWNVVTTAYAPFNKDRSVKRVAGDSALRYAISRLSVPQLQWAFGTTRSVYEQWTKANKLTSTIDELGQDARLMWIGPKRLDRVVLFSHGGAFSLPASDFGLSFWRYVQLELAKQNIEIGFALFSYSLYPTATFPTPLKQAGLALEFLLAAGVKPQNLQIVGDSAGANLILQLFSHMLHPRADMPEIHLAAPLRGAYLISPWVNLTADSKSHTENDGRDFIGKETLRGWGALILADVPEADSAFAEPVRAPEWWFKGVDRLVERVLVTAGGAECLRDDIVVVGEALKKHHAKTEIVVQAGGLHEDMFLDFLVNESKLGSLTPLTVAWLAAGFTEDTSA
ncbi:Alpha/Beta hydrolase protein [Mycena maculata]|uniref:Alpha/Beta hydrolase protein n=1 Tax=Mycena maculata TaxID=230809 RepID=A0AAD7MSS7_9AGAR|nr:Alpha/Beta hydrolase protein [Mycena maculata]